MAPSAPWAPRRDRRTSGAGGYSDNLRRSMFEVGRRFPKHHAFNFAMSRYDTSDSIPNRISLLEPLQTYGKKHLKLLQCTMTAVPPVQRALINWHFRRAPASLAVYSDHRGFLDFERDTRWAGTSEFGSEPEMSSEIQNENPRGTPKREQVPGSGVTPGGSSLVEVS